MPSHNHDINDPGHNHTTQAPYSKFNEDCSNTKTGGNGSDCSDPPVTPKTLFVKPGPAPAPTTTFPFKSGNPKVVDPSPFPNTVPITLNKSA